ncbi:MAG TPA: Mur ligase family protein [Thermotogota bacterium]|nr:Mur ligase family protein [Thermotogota bacterium]HPJ88481.1 Mur ligase family protein [Thermotogota bacterium]HPR96181.1 Mur ligase family protein [Thermotogota bacterium]
MALLIAGLILLTLLIFFIVEQRELRRKRNRIKTVIAVTGTRGKSTTVRFLTSLFQKNGFKTLGKITGTKASLILPDGTAQKIIRRGGTSIIEQKNILLKTASRLKIDVLITEIMSVTPEYQKMETQNILNPDYLVITNVKADHIGVSGSNKQEIAEMFVKSTPKATTCLTLEQEKNYFAKDTDRILFIKEDEDLKKVREIQPGFYETLLIADYFVKAFNLDRSLFLNCIDEFKTDDDVFYIKKRDKNTLFVNAFSANDPESTLRIIDEIRSEYPNHSIKGIFCTRPDKPNRTAQWIESFRNSGSLFNTVYVYGAHYGIIKRHRYSFALSKLQQKRFAITFAPTEEKTVFVGFGNYVKSGEHILKYWDEVTL